METSRSFRLMVIAEGGPGGTYLDHTRELGPSRQMIGRSPGCDVQLLGVTVSRAHCTVEAVLGQYVLVRDLGSSNGTYVGGHRVRGETKAFPGDEITVGTFHIIVCEHGQAPDPVPRLRLVR